MQVIQPEWSEGMDTQRVATEIRLAQWAQMIQGRMESMQSIKEFCQAAGVSKNTYFYWQRKLREAACKQFAENHESRTVPRIEAPGFAEVKLAEVQRTRAIPEFFEQGQVHIETGEVKITADSTYPAEKLAALLREYLRT